jgi:mRNA interferase MazF
VTLVPDRGEVWIANLNPGRGTEPGKTRPVLIVQSQALLGAGHPSTLIVPLTTNVVENAEPLRIRVPVSGRLRRQSDLLIDQLRAIDSRRLIHGPVARLSAPLMSQVGEAIRDVLDLDQA